MSQLWIVFLLAKSLKCPFCLVKCFNVTWNKYICIYIHKIASMHDYVKSRSFSICFIVHLFLSLFRVLFKVKNEAINCHGVIGLAVSFSSSCSLTLFSCQTWTWGVRFSSKIFGSEFRILDGSEISFTLIYEVLILWLFRDVIWSHNSTILKLCKVLSTF